MTERRAGERDDGVGNDGEIGDAEEAERGAGSDALAERELRRAVETVLPEATGLGVRQADHGKNAVALVAVKGECGGDEREVVLKVGTRFGGPGFLAEPRILSLVGERTEIPVPDVLGVDSGDAIGDPFFVAERVSGRNCECRPHALPPGVFERVCFEAGRNLGELHAAFAFDCFGPVRPTGLGEDDRRRENGDYGSDDGDCGDELGVENVEFGLAVAREFDGWPDLFETWAKKQVGALAGTRFADCVSGLEAYVSDAVEGLRGPFEPVLLHGDYRLGNLLLDERALVGNRGERENATVTNAVIDWEAPVAAHAEYELANAEGILVDWPELDEDRQRTLRERLYAGYEETNSLSRDDAFEQRRRIYRVATRVRLMRNLREEMAGRPEAAIDARAAEHRRFLDRLID